MNLRSPVLRAALVGILLFAAFAATAVYVFYRTEDPAGLWLILKTGLVVGLVSSGVVYWRGSARPEA